MKAPAKALNVVVVLLDDDGFAASTAFGCPINMPTLTATNSVMILANGASMIKDFDLVVIGGGPMQCKPSNQSLEPTAVRCEVYL